MPLTSWAEIYRWTDKDGKVHFDDKKPKAAAEDITAAVKKQNIDTSSQEHQKLETIFRKENDADREYQQQQAQPSQEQLQHCADAKKYLHTIDGRVNFVDDNGKPVNVTEEERKSRANKMREIIKEKCTD